MFYLKQNADHNIILTFVTFDWLNFFWPNNRIFGQSNRMLSLSPFKIYWLSNHITTSMAKNKLHKVLILELVLFSLKYKTTKKLLIPSAANYRRRSRSLNHHDGECKVITQIPFKASWCLTVQVFSRKTHSFSCIFWEISQTPWTTKQ